MIIFILFIISTFTFLFTWCTRSKLRQSLPPGPKQLSYVRSLITLLQNKPTFRWIHKVMNEMDTKILCIRLGNTHVIVVSDPTIAREFLKEKDEIFSSRPDCMSGYLTSGGYLTTVLVPFSDHWKKMRKTLATEILSSTRHKWLKSKRDEEADNLLSDGVVADLWQKQRKVVFLLIRWYIYNRCQINGTVTGEVMNIRIIVQQYSSNIIRKIVFGSRHFVKESPDGGPMEEEIEHVDSLLTILSYLYAFCVTDYFPLLRWITDLDGHEKIIRNAIRTARKHQDRLIDDRIQQWKDGMRTKEDDFLDVFINLKNPLLTPNQIKAQILELMLATFDNPSNAIEWAITEMINQPRIFDKAIQELDYVVGKDRLVQESDLPNLNYIKACAKEAFRLHPVAPFNLPHVAVVDTTVAGYFIPKGSHVLLSRVGLGRSPDVWDDPLTFNPDRHINANNEVVLTDYNLHMLSFSVGRRGCPAVLLGSTMTIMLLARLVQGFTWELPPNEPHVDLRENLLNLAKAKPLFALVKPRLPHHLYPTC